MRIWSREFINLTAITSPWFKSTASSTCWHPTCKTTSLVFFSHKWSIMISQLSLRAATAASSTASLYHFNTSRLITTSWFSRVMLIAMTSTSFERVVLLSSSPHATVRLSWFTRKVQSSTFTRSSWMCHLKLPSELLIQKMKSRSIRWLFRERTSLKLALSFHSRQTLFKSTVSSRLIDWVSRGV